MSLTLEEVHDALPSGMRPYIDQNYVDKLNTIATDPQALEVIRDGFITYSSVLKDGKYKSEDYMNAIVYVSYIRMGKSKEDAYSLTFPSRYRKLVAAGKSQKDISAYVGGYNKGKLVQGIMERVLTPAHVMYQDVFHEAILEQAKLMKDQSQPGMVRTTAANSLLNALKQPEKKESKLDITITDSSGMKELEDQLRQVAIMYQDAAKSGVNVADIAALPLIEGTAVALP